MQPAKKVEIVCDALEVKEVLNILEDIGISEYTVIRDVLGKGERGVRGGGDLTDVFKNSLVFTVCPEDLIPKVVEAVRPILKRFGGICLVSDTNYVIH
jgi:nitrogen regulatory protein PII